jgi:hypothetical protein
MQLIASMKKLPYKKVSGSLKKFARSTTRTTDAKCAMVSSPSVLSMHIPGCPRLTSPNAQYCNYKVKVAGIGSEANSTSVKMLTSARCQYLRREPDTRECTPVGKANLSVHAGWVALCISQLWLKFNFPNRSHWQRLKYKRAQTRQSENEQEHYGHSHISLALQYEITWFLPTMTIARRYIWSALDCLGVVLTIVPCAPFIEPA